MILCFNISFTPAYEVDTIIISILQNKDKKLRHREASLPKVTKYEMVYLEFKLQSVPDSHLKPVISSTWHASSFLLHVIQPENLT